MELIHGQSPAIRLARRGRRRGQRGFTLTEVLVVIAVLTVIGGSIAGAFAIGFRLLGPTGARASLTGNGDLLAVEQQIGADLARADCLAAPAQTSIPTTGCTVFKAAVGSCAAPLVICLAWYVPGRVPCHVVTYTQQASSDVLVRTDSAGSVARFTTGGLVVTTTWTASATTANGYLWTAAVTLTATQSGAPNAAASPAAGTFGLVPLVQDPVSPVIPTGSAPC